MAPLIRDLPIFIFLAMVALLWAAEFSTRALPDLGFFGGLALRMAGGELIKMYPSMGDPAQRLPALIAFVGSILYYGAVFGPAQFPGSRSFAFLIESMKLHLLLGPWGATYGALDSTLRTLAWIGVTSAAWSVFPVLFPWELRGAHEGPQRPSAVAAADSDDSAAAAAAVVATAKAQVAAESAAVAGSSGSSGGGGGVPDGVGVSTGVQGRGAVGAAGLVKRR